METADGQAALVELAAELDGRGWIAHLSQVLTVMNPAATSLNDRISCKGGEFRWAWGQAIGPVTEVAAAADRITYVLREVQT